MQVNKQLQKSILEIVDNQLHDNTPPQINITYKALKKMGYSDRDAKMAIGQALVKEMFEVLNNGREYSEKRYIADLKQIAQTGFFILIMISIRMICRLMMILMTGMTLTTGMTMMMTGCFRIPMSRWISCGRICTVIMRVKNCMTLRCISV